MKKRIRHGDPQRQSYWEEVVRRWREGGQSVRSFCLAEELRESAFYSWRRKLARGGRRTGQVGKALGQAIVTIQGHDFYLGPWNSQGQQGRIRPDYQ